MSAPPLNDGPGNTARDEKSRSIAESLPGIGPQRRRAYKYKYVMDNDGSAGSTPQPGAEEPPNTGISASLAEQSQPMQSPQPQVLTTETQAASSVAIPSSIRKFQSMYPVDADKLRSTADNEDALENALATVRAQAAAAKMDLDENHSMGGELPMLRPGLKGTIKISRYNKQDEPGRNLDATEPLVDPRATSISSLIHLGDLDRPKRARVVPRASVNLMINMEETPQSITPQSISPSRQHAIPSNPSGGDVPLSSLLSLTRSNVALTSVPWAGPGHYVGSPQGSPPQGSPMQPDQLLSRPQSELAGLLPSPTGHTAHQHSTQPGAQHTDMAALKALLTASVAPATSSPTDPKPTKPEEPKKKRQYKKKAPAAPQPGSIEALLTSDTPTVPVAADKAEKIDKTDTDKNKMESKRKLEEKPEGPVKKKRVVKPKVEKKPKAKKKDGKELPPPPKETKDPVNPTMTTDKASVGAARVPSPSLTAPEKSTAERPTIILDIPLLDPKNPKPGRAEVVIDVLKLAEEKYGWATVHPDAKSAIDIMDEMIEDDEDGVEVENDEEGEEKPKEQEREANDEADNDAEKQKDDKEKGKRKEDEDLTEEQLVKRHEAKMNRKVGKYDYEDPFIDDDELQWEEEIASTKEGFFVFWGPLVDDRTKGKKKK